MFTLDFLQIGDLSTSQMKEIADCILNFEVNYSMDLASQITMKIIDPGFAMGSNNYFQIGRDLFYTGSAFSKIGSIGEDALVGTKFRDIFEISAVSVSQENSASPVWTITALPKAVMQMKRDKKPHQISGSGYSYAQNAAKKYGLDFVGEKSSRIKSGSKNSGDGQSDSVWEVLRRIADESQYVLFVSDGTLYFATQKWLLYKWGTDKLKGSIKKNKDGKVIINSKTKLPEKNPDKNFIPMEYVGFTEDNRKFDVLKLPEIRRSDNDPMEATGSLTVSRYNGVMLRPGMTIRINNVPTMRGYFLITSVTFSQETTDPVSIEFRTPERLNINGKQPKIPQLPIGKIFKARESIAVPAIGRSSLGVSNTNSTYTEVKRPPRITDIVEQLPNSGVMLPNERRSIYHPPIVGNSAVLIGSVSGDLRDIATIKIPSSAIYELGGIDLYNRPLYKFTNIDGKNVITTSYVYLVNDISNVGFVILVEGVWCDEGNVVLLSEGDAVSKLEDDGLHHGIISSDHVSKYVKSHYEMQKMLIKKRFPNSYTSIFNGSAKIGNVC